MATDTTSRSELNAWLVEEMYDQYREDPSQLSEAWQDFFEDYRPGGGLSAGMSTDQLRARPAAEPSPAAPEADGARTGVAAGRPVDADDDSVSRIRGAGQRVVQHMEASLGVPTATSVRDVPAKLLEVNRQIVNNYLARSRGGKVSFTHLIAYAVVRAAAAVPAMTRVYARTGQDKPAVVHSEHFGLGLAVDVAEEDGGRKLLVPVIKEADKLSFQEFLQAYEELIRRVRTNRLDPDMFAGATITVTNPGMLGTVHSVPRLMAGQAAIVGVGSIDYPAEYQAADPRTIAQLGVSKVLTLTSTYDHRVIQGAESGRFLGRIHELLLGEDGFYDEIFRSLGLPYEPARWRPDVSPVEGEDAALEKQSQVDQLAHMYRVRGHLIADLDPLRQSEPFMHDELDPIHYGLSIWDLDREFLCEGFPGEDKLTLGKILSILRDAYCRTFGVEYMHIQEPVQKEWFREQLEGVPVDVPDRDQSWILERLNAAEAFESFLHTKYIGQKRFGLEGAEALIPLLDALCEAAADGPITDVVMGMAHRGRLNVLSNVVGKPLRGIFREFEGDIDPDTVQGSGDVKYHLGTEGSYLARSGNEVALHMPPNPSHLESVDPVVEGVARAMQDRAGRAPDGPFPVLPLLMHGDAAFAGQGVVSETLNLSQLPGYRTGGTIHVVINNQLGFTTAPESARSSVYPTDIAKTVQAPILHVNADDPEAVVRMARLAFAFRQTFDTDVVIDLVCYRRHGHNEADDPSFTQPRMYEAIDNRRSVRKLYTERLVKRGDISIDQAEAYLEDFEQRLQEAFEQTKQAQPPEPPKAILPPESAGPRPRVPTGVDRTALERIAATQFDEPDGFTRHPKLDRIFKKARERFEAGEIGWALGETLAFGSLLLEGTDVRLAGQDSRRGTFSQRHAVQVDFETGEEYFPLADLADEQGRWFIYDSLLSEYAAMGFEYGYSLEATDALVCWEAQFGDFANGAQVVIDEFVVAAEDKWDLNSGLVLLLPHGYEGQGPDHSSARIERFLTLCAEDNITVCQPTTAAQYFHLLRRQIHSEVHRPLVVFTPKSLLRSPDAVSTIDEFTGGSYREVLDDPRVAAGGLASDEVTSVAVCSGKLAHELAGERDGRERPMAVVRVEQLYPWPRDQLVEVLAGYPQASEVVWCQEEPGNMGPRRFVTWRLKEILEELGGERRLRCVSRVPSASPAAGQHVVHEQEQRQLIEDVFQPAPDA